MCEIEYMKKKKTSSDFLKFPIRNHFLFFLFFFIYFIHFSKKNQNVSCPIRGSTISHPLGWISFMVRLMIPQSIGLGLHWKIECKPFGDWHAKSPNTHRNGIRLHTYLEKFFWCCGNHRDQHHVLLSRRLLLLCLPGGKDGQNICDRYSSTDFRCHFYWTRISAFLALQSITFHIKL